MFYENANIYIEKEKAQIPWLKIFTKEPYKELSSCPLSLQRELFNTIVLCEKAMIAFYKPEKINIASFANYLPRVHFHIMARFKEDAFFPECMWGKQQRQMKDLALPKFEDFVVFLTEKLLQQ
ncbi:HIT family protein [Campylobacter sp. MIT 21-1685]|uniref:HIT family protein n=1 Tax=unclassified Campylobacter TaxID=2593542 RepID=UPI00224B87F8|nr:MULTISPECIES: HIT family protein [unclassified Campylobacter]MCX2683832.1 HIT family protein [Campylobacter sp. MIT 21-1684]MCX2752116.1 HIT family protein [Campylobacter sp. MIT 21-1682]MCX2808309.1 HIT family protein [Campylobacter sp. MIT 21-1685]